MILSGNEIRLQHEAGTIVIEPWEKTVGTSALRGYIIISPGKKP